MPHFQCMLTRADTRLIRYGINGPLESLFARKALISAIGVSNHMAARFKNELFMHVSL